jgi:rare lipoprotein A (peptidoglycan hydrolase)
MEGKQMKHIITFILVAMISHVAADYRGNDADRWSKLDTDEVIGTATWYGTGQFLGVRTPSGIICDGKTPQAAHRTLPFGLVVRVCNVEEVWEQPGESKCVVVVITDRGPYVKSKPERILDLNAKWSINALCGEPCGMVNVVIDVLDDTYACGSADEADKSFRCFSKVEYQYKGETRTFGKYLDPHEIELLGLGVDK